MNRNHKTSRRCITALLTVAMATGFAGNALAQKGNYTDVDLQEGGVWYELNVGTFCDSDGDGTGDFTGARQKLDYLEDLGVTGIWVQPINTSNASAYSTIDNMA